LSALPTPSAKVIANNTIAVVCPVAVRAPSVAAAASIQSCVPSSSRRRSTTSARAPAGSASSSIGAVPAVWTSETMSGDGASEVMSQPAPTSCIQVPTKDTSELIQMAR
jgi:hypothetical protein